MLRAKIPTDLGFPTRPGQPIIGVLAHVGAPARRSGCYRILTGLLTTARKCGGNLLDALDTVAGPSPFQAAGMAP